MKPFGEYDIAWADELLDFRRTCRIYTPSEYATASTAYRESREEGQRRYRPDVRGPFGPTAGRRPK